VALTDIGMSVDNTNDPAVLIVSSGDTGPDTNSYTMTWYALPDENTSHAQITRTFTWVIYTALTGVTHTSYDAEYIIKISETD